jgi:hypothetical protein
MSGGVTGWSLGLSAIRQESCDRWVPSRAKAIRRAHSHPRGIDRAVSAQTAAQLGLEVGRFEAPRRQLLVPGKRGVPRSLLREVSWSLCSVIAAGQRERLRRGRGGPR